MSTTRGLRARVLLLPAAMALALSAQHSIASADPPDREIRQEAGKTVYWVLPGPRRLSPAVFGTAENPKMTFKPRLDEAEAAVAAKKMPPAVPETMRKVPAVVAVPVEARVTDQDGNLWLEAPNPFSDDAIPVSGSFTARFWDEVKEDPPGPPGETPDRAELDVEWTDPDGNAYRVVLDHVVKPPFPGYDTQGGVVTDTYLHGGTGVGSPLMSQLWTIAGVWGIAELYVNGEMVESNRVVHFMTTEIVRDKDYRLALQEELPLPPERWHVKGQPHHSHLFVSPFVGIPGRGPVFQPVPTEFELPNGKNQPFMHIMFEEDEIVG